MPTWLADWLGITAFSEAEGATWQFDSAWYWAPWATLLLVLAAIAWTIALYVRESATASRGYRALLIGLRLVAIALVLVMLAQWALALRLTGPPTLALVIDRSASMGTVDRYEDQELVVQLEKRLRDARLEAPTRINLAKLLATEADGRLLQELAERFRLKVYFGADSVEKFDSTGDVGQLVQTVRELSATGPDSQATRLGDAVEQVLDELRGATPAAVVLLTDGVTTAGVPLASAAQKARRKGVPIFAVGLGSPDPPKDIELADVLVDDAVFVDDLVSFQLRIKASGLAGQTVKVVLRREGDAAPLTEATVTLPSESETRSTLLVHRPASAGEIEYEIEIAARDDETDKQNNRQRRRVSVRDEKIRVLLAQGYPSFEFRYLKTLLERDATIQLAVYLQDADREFAEQDKSALRSFPISRDELMEYDVLLVGDMDPRLLPPSTWHNIRDFVAAKGGGMAFLSGPRYMPWSYRDVSDARALLPLEIDSALSGNEQLPDKFSSGFVVRPTPLGLQMPAMQLGASPAETAEIWKNLTPLYWMAGVGEPKPAAQVLAVTSQLSATDSSLPGSAIPLILFQYVGPGRVLFHAFDSSWRWRLGAGDAFFARYWVQTIRFLARGKLLSGRGATLSADRREYRRGEVANLRLRFLDPRVAPAGDEATVLIDAAGQRRRRITLHRSPSAAGVFEGSVTGISDGQYEAVLAEPRLPGNPPITQFLFVAPPGELARVEMDSATLAAAAETTRGKFFTIADADRLLEELPAGRRVPLANLPSIPLWNRWWLLVAFLTCITSEWILRKRKGML
jgi:hypothetical protein